MVTTAECTCLSEKLEIIIHVISYGFGGKYCPYNC